MLKKPKYAFLSLKKFIEDIGKTFTEFMDEARNHGDSPSRRTWANATNAKIGVALATANKMQRLLPGVFDVWKEELPKSVKNHTKL